MQAAEIKSRIGEAGADYLVQYPARAFLDCSTAHLTEATHAWLDAELRDVRANQSRVVGGIMPYGWFVWVPTDVMAAEDRAALPADLLAVMDAARAMRCEYVLFDRDASPDAIPELPTYEETEA